MRKLPVARFFERATLEESLEISRRLALAFAKASGPDAEKLVQAVSARDYRSLAYGDVTYRPGTDPVSLFAARQCLALFQKHEELPLSVDKELVALRKFIQSEQQCRETNERIRSSRFRRDIPLDVNSVILTAKRKISEILGPLPKFESLSLKFGPGANTNCRRRTSARWKLSAALACSKELQSSAKQVLSTVPHLARAACRPGPFGPERPVVKVESGRLTFVPKNAKTYRSIMIEPSLNTMVQQGYGKFLKQRLLKHGVNLYDQTINRQLARKGSLLWDAEKTDKWRGLATVDLSSASDTIAYELVFALLPIDWAFALASCRTGTAVYRDPEGRNYEFRLQKFSSMGNSYTFELESLIFFGLTYAVCVLTNMPLDDISVYGDDIIVPSDAAHILQAVFQELGFSINPEKSYLEGPFRESCGADWYCGFNIRPFYLKSNWSPADLTSFHNFLKRNGWHHDPRFDRVRETILSLIPDHLALLGPDGYGDGHLISDDWIPRRKPSMVKRGFCGWIFDTFVRKERRIKGLLPGDAILPVYSIYVSASVRQDVPEHAVKFLNRSRHARLYGGYGFELEMKEPLDHFVVRGEAGEKKITVYTLTS